MLKTPFLKISMTSLYPANALASPVSLNPFSIVSFLTNSNAASVCIPCACLFVNALALEYASPAVTEL